MGVASVTALLSLCWQLLASELLYAALCESATLEHNKTRQDTGKYQRYLSADYLSLL